MKRVREALAQLAGQAYPDLSVVSDEHVWLAGDFTPPAVFVYAGVTGEAPGTLTTQRVRYEAAVVLHFGKDEHGARQPLSAEPLSTLLRQERFQYPAVVEGERILLAIDEERYSIRPGDRQDRLEITFPLEVAVKRPAVSGDRIDKFELEWGGAHT
jgi:hypothetical protein